MSARAFPLVALLAAALTAAFIATGVRADAPAPSLPSVVEEVRYTRANGFLVEYRVYVDRTIQPDASAVADALTGIPATSGTVTAQFELNPWKWASRSIPVPVYYNPANPPAGVSPERWLQSALAQWSSVTSTFSFTYAGHTTAGFDACEAQPQPDGINTVGFVTGLPTGVLGQTCTLTDPQSGNLVEFDTELNTDVNWGDGSPIASNQYDLPSTILHELGHAAGLAHPCEPPYLSRCTTAEYASVMYYSIGRGKMKRTLQPDDIAALMAQYPGGTSVAAASPTQSTSTGPASQRTFEVYAAALAHD